VELVVEVDVGAAGGIESGQQFADDDEELAVRWLLDETTLHLLLVGFRRRESPEDVLRVGVKLVSLVAVGRLTGDRRSGWLVGGDDGDMTRERRVLKEAEVVAGVVD
jgi:hypothetical protein